HRGAIFSKGVQMASLESKLLDGKNAGYCSSSEDEEEEGGFRQVNDDDEHQARVMKKMGGGNQSGAKGVIGDYEEYQKMKMLKAVEANRANGERARRGMISTSKEERERAEREEMGDEETLEMLRERRLTEMRRAAQGKIVELPGKMELLSTIEDTNGLLVVLLYEDGHERSGWATHLIRLLASAFPHIRVCRIKASLAGMSDRFVADGVPALQVYYRGELPVNLVPLHSHIGEDATIANLIDLLRKNNINLGKNRLMDEGESESDDE
ncbi:hypothetical protein PMAYCL1PPCAC_17842, partial [Pristionchus mayeri]